MWIGWIVGSGAIWSMLIIMGERLIVFSSLVDQLKTLLTGLLHITSVNLNQSAHAGYQQWDSIDKDDEGQPSDALIGLIARAYYGLLLLHWWCQLSGGGQLKEELQMIQRPQISIISCWMRSSGWSAAAEKKYNEESNSCGEEGYWWSKDDEGRPADLNWLTWYQQRDWSIDTAIGQQPRPIGICCVGRSRGYL